MEKEENNKIKIGKQKIYGFEKDDKILNKIIIVHNLDTSYVKWKHCLGREQGTGQWQSTKIRMISYINSFQSGEKGILSAEWMSESLQETKICKVPLGPLARVQHFTQGD